MVLGGPETPQVPAPAAPAEIPASPAFPATPGRRYIYRPGITRQGARYMAPEKPPQRLSFLNIRPMAAHSLSL